MCYPGLRVYFPLDQCREIVAGLEKMAPSRFGSPRLPGVFSGQKDKRFLANGGLRVTNANLPCRLLSRTEGAMTAWSAWVDGTWSSPAGGPQQNATLVVSLV